MKVLLTNGSPHKEGCTYTALCEVSEALNRNGIDTDIFWIGNKALSGCIACKKCIENNKCVFWTDADADHYFQVLEYSTWSSTGTGKTGFGRASGYARAG